MTFRLWPLWVKGGLIATFPRTSALPLNSGRNLRTEVRRCHNKGKDILRNSRSMLRLTRAVIASSSLNMSVASPQLALPGTEP
jgi:hypothetical protein